jgi:hypothetical protein
MVRMTTPEKAQAIIDMCRNKEKLAHGHVIDARVRLAGQEAMRMAWEEEHKDDLGCFGNPYTIEGYARTATDAECEWTAAGQVLEFAIKHFLQFIPEGS